MTSISKLRLGKELDSLQIDDIQIIIDNKIDESQSLDYKQVSSDAQKDCDNIAQVISGFLNSDGGIIVYGVSESRDKEHCYPNQIVWCNYPKERIENLLLSRVQPWDERIKIQRIPNKNNPTEGIFVIEVPKSNNPPHMYSNRYYQRLNFQDKPMSHEAVYRAFQTSWIRKRDIQKRIIEPLYSEINVICASIYNFEEGEIEKFYKINYDDKYLYDQLEYSLRELIEHFYDMVEYINPILNWKYHEIAIKIINSELMKILPARQADIKSQIDRAFLKLNVELEHSSGKTKLVPDFDITPALFMKVPLNNYFEQKFEDEKVVSFTPYLESLPVSLSRTEFEKLWQNCERQAKNNNQFMHAWKIKADIFNLGKEIRDKMSSS